MTDAREARRQGVEQEPADKLVDGESHRAGLVGIGGAVLFELKRHLLVVDIQNPAVVEGDAVCIAAQPMKTAKLRCEP